MDTNGIDGGGLERSNTEGRANTNMSTNPKTLGARITQILVTLVFGTMSAVLLVWFIYEWIIGWRPYWGSIFIFFGGYLTHHFVEAFHSKRKALNPRLEAGLMPLLWGILWVFYVFALFSLIFGAYEFIVSYWKPMLRISELLGACWIVGWIVMHIDRARESNASKPPPRLKPQVALLEQCRPTDDVPPVSPGESKK